MPAASSPDHTRNPSHAEMKGRHRIALLCMIGALAIFYTRARLEPRWFWDAAYWALLLIGLLTLIRGTLSRRRR